MIDLAPINSYAVQANAKIAYEVDTIECLVMSKSRFVEHAEGPLLRAALQSCDDRLGLVWDRPLFLPGRQ